MAISSAAELVSTTTPIIWVACLASYNAGKLWGEWIDATQDPDDIRAEIDAMLEGSPEPGAEEFAIFDYQNFGKAKIDEYEPIAEVHAKATLIEEYPEYGAELIAYCDDVEEARDKAENDYSGSYERLGDWAAEQHETSDIPEDVEPFVDWDRMAQDAKECGYILTVQSGGRVHVFHGH